MIDTGTKPKRKVYSSRVKFQAVLEVIKGKSVGEIARAYGFHPTMFSKWRRKFEEQGYQVFDEGKKDESKNHRDLRPFLKMKNHPTGLMILKFDS